MTQAPGNPSTPTAQAPGAPPPPFKEHLEKAFAAGALGWLTDALARVYFTSEEHPHKELAVGIVYDLVTQLLQADSSRWGAWSRVVRGVKLQAASQPCAACMQRALLSGGAGSCAERLCTKHTGPRSLSAFVHIKHAGALRACRTRASQHVKLLQLSPRPTHYTSTPCPALPSRTVEALLQAGSVDKRARQEREDAVQSQAVVVVQDHLAGPSAMDADSKRPGAPEPDDLAALLHCLAACFDVNAQLWLDSKQSQAYSVVSDLMSRLLLSRATLGIPEVSRAVAGWGQEEGSMWWQGVAWWLCAGGCRCVR